MHNIAFIVNSCKLQLYFYKCIQAIIENFENCKIDIIIDKKAQPIAFNFNKFINQVDDRFSNFKQKPLEVLNIDDLELPIYEIINSNQNLKMYDWIILENINFDCKIYESFTKNGFIALDFDFDAVKNQVVSSNNVVLNICNKNQTDKVWTNNQQNLIAENGFRNNVYKLLFNYNVYLIKFLKTFDSNQKSISSNPTKKSKVFFFQSIYYYLDLVLTIITRKIFSQKLNWKIAIQKENQTFLLNQPKNSFWADPFVVKLQDEIIIFFEELKPNKLGCISCVIVDHDFNIKEKKVIIDKDYHLSFPNVFLHNHTYYMIPESSANNSLDIYKCTNFPFEWQFHSKIIDNMKLLDPVVLFFENKYWIFANKVHDFEFDNNEKLFIYYANDLFSGNWQAHIQNPVVTSAKSARNAGQIYSENNKLYRVSQNCSANYGGNIVVNEILNLSTTDYKEMQHHEILCPKLFKGMHTINFHDDIKVVDYLNKN